MHDRTVLWVQEVSACIIAFSGMPARNVEWNAGLMFKNLAQ